MTVREEIIAKHKKENVPYLQEKMATTTPLHQQIADLKQALGNSRRAHRATIKEANTDSLTKSFNRKGLIEAFTKTLDSEDGALILVDLDLFKPINDQFGHAAGDQALRTVARHLESHFREHDIVARLPRNKEAPVARIGGDEFVIVFQGLSKKEAKKKLKTLTESFNTLTMDWKQKGKTTKIKIGASLGMATFKSGDQYEDVMKKADKKMYAVKKAKGHKR